MKTSAFKLSTALVLGSVFLHEASGEVIGWGNNYYGASSFVATELTNVVQIAAGAYHYSGLKRDGTIVSQSIYGNNPNGLSNVTAIVVNTMTYEHRDYSLAVKIDGTVAGWGTSFFTSPSSPPLGLSNVIAVSAGLFHALALKADGSVVAWGDNYFGETNVPAGLNSVVAIAAGAYYSLALKADGTVVAWGGAYNPGGANVPAGLSNVVAIAAGYYHAIALRADGRVVAWGDYYYGELNVPRNLSNVIAIASGGIYDLALRHDGTVVGWGYNELHNVNVPTGLTNVTGISAGRFALALKGDGPPFSASTLIDLTTWAGSTVWMSVSATGDWPLTYQWALNGVNLPEATNAVLGLTNVQLSQAGNYSVTVSNSFGTITTSNVLSVVPFIITIQPTNQSVFGGTTVKFEVTSIGLSPSYQWQFNGTNLLGATNSSLTLTNVQLNQAGAYAVVISYESISVVSSNAVLEVSPLGITVHPQPITTYMGNQVSFNVDATGIPPINYQWQLNGVDLPGETNSSLALTNLQPSQSGNYSAVVSNPVTSVNSSNAFLSVSRVVAWGSLTSLPIGLSNVVGIACGYSHNLALKDNGTVIAWGANDVGQSSVPSTLTNAIAIAAGAFHSLALRTDGTVIGWGANTWGLTAFPSGLTNIVAIASGTEHSLALNSAGTVIAWGYYLDGETNVPPGLSNVVAIGAGDYHSFALKRDGTLIAWGWNDYGQTSVPDDLTNAVAVTGGFSHSLAMKSDGTIAIWGDNQLGQIDVTPDLTNVLAVACGGVHNLVLMVDGTIRLWGYNSQTTAPTNIHPVISVCARGDHNLALLGESPPTLHGPLTDATHDLNSFTARIPTQSGRVYSLEYKTGLADSDWIPLPLVAGNGGMLTLTDATATNDTQRFYRVKRW